MDRQKALELMSKYIQSEHIIKHSYAVEVVMRALAQKFEPEKEELWAMTGLLHDLDVDFDACKQDPKVHGIRTVEILKQEGFGNEEMYHSICAHNQATGVAIESKMDQAIYAADPITGFITAIALVYPDKKVASVKVKSITKRMDEVRFAAGADRNAMRSIENMGMSFAEFAELALKAMVEIGWQLGL